MTMPEYEDDHTPPRKGFTMADCKSVCSLKNRIAYLKQQKEIIDDKISIMELEIAEMEERGG